MAAGIWLVAAVIDILLAFDFVFKLLGAHATASFVDFIYRLSAIFAAPFHGIWPAQAAGTSYLDPADIVAIVVYAVIAWLLISLVKIVTAPPGTPPATPQ